MKLRALALFTRSAAFGAMVAPFLVPCTRAGLEGRRRLRAILTVAFVLLISASANAQSLLFTRTDIPTGGVARKVAMADFNRDGILDIAILSPSAGLSILLGKGDGTFGNPSITPSLNVPRVMAVGDRNGDGILDIVVEDDGSGQLNVLLGKGDGSFATALKISGVASGLAIGDFNGDGKPDLAATDFSTGRMFIYFGNGDGTFSDPYYISVGTASEPGTGDVVATDLNRDGKLDLIAVNMFAATISVLLGNGDGTSELAFQVQNNRQPFREWLSSRVISPKKVVI